MNSLQAHATGAFDVEALRRDFPILHQKINGQPLVYLDNAATTQKPECVIDAISDFASASPSAGAAVPYTPTTPAPS